MSSRAAANAAHLIVVHILVAAAAAQEPPATPTRQQDFGDEPVIVEYSRTQARFEADGTGRVARTSRLRLQASAAIDAFGQLVFGYNSANERLDVESVVATHQDGTSAVAAPGAVQDLSGPVGRVAPVYTDYREKHITVPALRVGDVLEWNIVWHLDTPLATDRFWFDHEFTRDAIVLEELLEVDVPAAADVTVKTRTGAEAESVTQGDRTLYRWRRENLQRTDSTSLDWVELARLPDVGITTFASWKEVGRWYHELQRDRTATTPAMTEIVAQVVAARDEPLQHVRALYDYVATQVRYVSLSFGLGRYQPHAADEVLQNKYGDCKDKHTLLAALLSTRGTRAFPVLVSAFQEIDPDVPSPSQFDHVVSAVEVGDAIWLLDTTTEVAPFGLLTANLRGKRALLVRDSLQSRIIEIPYNPPFTTSDELAFEGSLSAAGKLDAAVQYRTRGDGEIWLRHAFRSTPKTSWRDFIQNWAAAVGLPGEVKRTNVPDPQNTSEAFSFDFDLSASQYVTMTEDRVQLSVPAPPIEFDTTGLATGDSLELGPRSAVNFRIRIQLPDGVRAQAPVNVNVTRDYLTYRSTYSVVGRELVAERVLTTDGGKHGPQRRLEFAAALRAIRADEKQQFQLEWLARLESIADDSQDVDELHDTGYAALERGDLVTAGRYLRRVVELDPSHQWGWNNLGRVYLGTGELDSAALAIEKQIEINPYDEWAHNNLGRARWRQGRRDEAVEAFRRQIDVNPLDRFAHDNLGRLLLEIGEFEASINHLGVALSLSPDDESLLIEMGEALLASGRADSALSVFEHAIARSPTAPTRNDVAYALANHGAHLERAKAWAAAAISSTGVHAPVSTGRSRPDEYNNEFTETESLGEYWDTMGWVLFRSGDSKAALEYVNAAWLTGFRARAADHLGQIYERLGKPEDAVLAYANALAREGMSGEDLSDTRARLRALVGTDADVEQRIVQTNVDSHFHRSPWTIRLEAVLHEDVRPLLVVVQGPGGKVEGVDVFGRTLDYSRVIAALRRAELPGSPPDERRVRLVKMASLACARDTGDCFFTLLPAARFSSIQER